MKLQFIEAGEIVTTHGVNGEMKMLPWVDSPEFMLQFNRVQIEGKSYEVESCRIQKTCNLLKISGIDTMEKAQSFRGKTVEIYRCDAPEDLIFAAELIGLDVIANGENIGQIVDVLDYPGNKVYVVKGEYEYMIPAVKQFILSSSHKDSILPLACKWGILHYFDAVLGAEDWKVGSKAERARFFCCENNLCNEETWFI